ncbi:MAG: type II toxin-antitoxin system Phd/YefM family antitoxin [Bacteroidota bacterium]
MQTKTTVNRLPLTKARVNLGSLIRRVHNNKEHFILEKDGIPVAALLDVDEYEDYLDLQDPGLKQQIKEGYEEYRRGKLTHDLDTYLAGLKAKSKKHTKR